MCSSQVEPLPEWQSWCASADADTAAAWAELPTDDDVLDADLERARPAWIASRARDDAAAAARALGFDAQPLDVAGALALVSVDPADLDADARVAWLAAVGRVHAWWESRLDDGMVAVAGPATRLVAEPRGRAQDYRAPAVMVDPDREEVAVALHCSPSRADRRITTARRLAALLPGTRAALRTATLDHARAAVIADAAGDLLRGLPDAADPTGPCPDPHLVAAAVDVCARLEARVLPRAGDRPLAALRRSCARAVHRIDPAGALARGRAARRTRDVWLTPEPDGTALLFARLDAATAERCRRRVRDAAEQLRDQARAAGHPDDGTRVGEWRAEAFAALLTQGQVPGLRLPDVGLELVIDLPTLLGLADHPAQTAGGAPVPAAEARALIAGADRVFWRRLVTDPVTGALLDYGRTTYRLPDRLRRFVTARDRTCRFPCCDHPATARDIDVDHAIAWDDGGATSAANTGALHRRHHRLKTHHGWTIAPPDDDGGVTVTSPHGLRRVVPATPQLDGSAPDPDPPPF